MIGILGAMQAEVDRLISAIRNCETRDVLGHRFYTGTIDGHRVVISRCGVGKVNAAVSAQTMIMAFDPKIIINTGVAGSLTSAFGILDVAVAIDAVQHDYDTTALGEPAGALSISGELVTYFPCDSMWRDRLLDASRSLGIRALPARIASGDRFITNSEDKRRIVNTFSAQVCEMEGAAIAQTCYIAGVPCAILRAISDSTDGNHSMEYAEFLPLAVEKSCSILLTMLQDMPIDQPKEKDDA
ncbi:MAG: 5'-methylthioadenosine/adenosylhomocysteine nucleosidase [Clostridia bacterium]|nr:5'-methylthioadenosine/adenosylhomocysteine nucleosidase [Clostridia bacterium]